MTPDMKELFSKQNGEVQQIVEIAPADTPQAPGTNWPAAIHSLLRGRYRLAIGLALAGALIGSIAAYRVVPVKYRSSGMIRIHSNVAPVLSGNEHSGQVPNFNGFVETQIGLLQDRRLITAALQESDWRNLDRGDSPEDVVDFAGRLDVSHPDGSELVVIAFTDPEPDAAVAGVHSVITAYKRLYVAGDAEDDSARMAVLVDLQNRYDADLRNLNDRILAIANEFGSDSLGPVYEFRLHQMQKLEADLFDLHMQVAALGGQADAEAGVASATTRPAAPPTLAQIAAADPQMRQLMVESAAAHREADLLSSRLGPRNPGVLTKQEEASRIDQDIEMLRQAYATSDPTSVIGRLRARLDAVRPLYESAKRDVYDVGRKNLQIADLRQQAEGIRTKLQETRQRIDSLNVEAAVNNRVSVISYGDNPLRPYKDRRNAAAAFGGFGGAALGFGSVVLLRLLDRRVRGLADARLAVGSETPVLGILPDLSADGLNGSAKLIAAHEIHCIRAGLQGPSPASGHVLGVTSAGPGDGKTSLALALGYSFANAGARTLLVDFDLVGRNLSTRMNRAVRPPIGRILRQLGLVTSDQVHDALRAAAETHQLVGQILVGRGLVGQADVLHALEIQNQQVVGLIDALGGVSLNDCVVGTGTENLSLLPVGKAQAHHIARLSPKGIQRLIAAARASYDAVIIDTGPILGSLEARLIAAQADQMIVAVSHGTQRSNVLQAVNQLKACGAKLAGVVFNRATPHDLLMSASTTSFRSRADSADELSPYGHNGHRDALASAVVSSFDRRTLTEDPDADESLQ